MGKFNGFGGKVEGNETIAEAAQRELKEEAGIIALDLCECGLIDFEFLGDPLILVVHVFRATKWSGTIHETDEMAPQWFPIHQIPFSSMWKDDEQWFPYLLGGRYFRGSFVFLGHQTIVHQQLRVSDTPQILSESMTKTQKEQEELERIHKIEQKENGNEGKVTQLINEPRQKV